MHRSTAPLRSILIPLLLGAFLLAAAGLVADVKDDCGVVLYSKNKERRITMMDKLGKLKSIKGAWVFVHDGVLKDEDPDIREAGLRNLIRMQIRNSDYYIEPVVKRLAEEPDYRVRKKAIEYFEMQTGAKWLKPTHTILIERLADKRKLLPLAQHDDFVRTRMKLEVLDRKQIGTELNLTEQFRTHGYGVLCVVLFYVVGFSKNSSFEPEFKLKRALPYGKSGADTTRL